MKKIFKTLFKLLLLLIIILLLTVGLLNLTKKMIYSNYYQVMEKQGVNPGLNSGYIPQGITKINDKYLTSGYLSDGPSRLYLTDGKDSVYMEVLLQDGTKSNGHFGGVAATNENVFIATENSILIIDILDVLDGDSLVKVIKEVKLDLNAAFIYTDINDEYLYVGEFNYGTKYVANHPEMVNDNKDEYRAYLNKYSVSDILAGDTTEVLHYSIRDKVQGVVVTNNRIYLSTSYGLKNSKLYVYELPTKLDKDNVIYLDDRYYLGSLKVPPMLESLDYDGENLITMFESACNKYMFGKLFFTTYIASINTTKLEGVI